MSKLGPQRANLNRILILAELSQGGSFGLEIIESIRVKSRGLIILKQGSVYPMIRSLRDEGYVEGEREEEPRPFRGGRARYSYEITAKGRAELEKYRTALAIILDLKK